MTDLAPHPSHLIVEGPLGIYLASVAVLIYHRTLWSFHFSVSAFVSSQRLSRPDMGQADAYPMPSPRSSADAAWLAR
jgi:hypothetical protein